MSLNCTAEIVILILMMMKARLPMVGEFQGRVTIFVVEGRHHNRNTAADCAWLYPRIGSLISNDWLLYNM